MAPRPLSKSERDEVEMAQAVVAYARDMDGGKCKEQLPPDPPGDDPCNKYYRNTAEESQAAREAFDDLKNVNNPNRPAIFDVPGLISVAHRVPLAAGGCPIGPRNLAPVTDPDCGEIEKMLGTSQGKVAEIARAKK
jgi:hypothetical protein